MRQAYIHDAVVTMEADGVTTHWRLCRAEPGQLRDDEAGHAERLIRH